MLEDKGRLVIIGSFLWIAMAATTILSTHRGAVAQDGSGVEAPPIERVLQPLVAPDAQSC